jgi:hypothetical protein
MSDKFQQYLLSRIAELRPYEPGESMEGNSISTTDKEAGSPKPDDMIARNPKNAELLTAYRRGATLDLRVPSRRMTNRLAEPAGRVLNRAGCPWTAETKETRSRSF